MMMVPMMVPQDAVTQIATGYPAAHQYQAAASACTTPFMPTTMTMTNNSSSQQHHHPHFTNTATPHPWMGGGVNMSSSASYHPHHTSTTSGGVPGAQLGHQHYQHFIHNMPSTSMPPSSQPHQYNYPAVGPSILQPSGEPHTSTTASEATATALTHVAPSVTSFGMHSQQQQQQQQHASHGAPSIATNTAATATATTTIPHNSYPTTPLHSAAHYPSQGHDAISTVMMNHPYQHAHANATAVAGAPNNTSYSSFAANDTSTSHLQQQHQQQQQSLVQHHHDESDKPLVQDTTTTQQGGGGNLAHCA